MKSQIAVISYGTMACQLQETFYASCRISHITAHIVCPSFIPRIFSITPGGDFTVTRDLFYPGFEFYGGSLGIGLGMAAGLALGAKLNREDWFTFCVFCICDNTKRF